MCTHFRNCVKIREKFELNFRRKTKRIIPSGEDVRRECRRPFRSRRACTRLERPSRTTWTLRQQRLGEDERGLTCAAESSPLPVHESTEEPKLARALWNVKLAAGAVKTESNIQCRRFNYFDKNCCFTPLVWKYIQIAHNVIEFVLFKLQSLIRASQVTLLTVALQIQWMILNSFYIYRFL